MDIESFYLFKERYNLSLAFNNLLAYPSFILWLEGILLEIN